MRSVFFPGNKVAKNPVLNPSSGTRQFFFEKSANPTTLLLYQFFEHEKQKFFLFGRFGAPSCPLAPLKSQKNFLFLFFHHFSVVLLCQIHGWYTIPNYSSICILFIYFLYDFTAFWRWNEIRHGYSNVHFDIACGSKFGTCHWMRLWWEISCFPWSSVYHTSVTIFWILYKT